MGVFSINIEVGRPGGKTKWVRIEKVIVDTGAELTWLPEAELQSAGIEMFKKDQTFVMANGQQVTRDVGIAILRCGAFKTVDEVVFARPGDIYLLGARTLEGFNAIPEPRKKKLISAGAIPAA